MQQQRPGGGRRRRPPSEFRSRLLERYCSSSSSSWPALHMPDSMHPGATGEGHQSRGWGRGIKRNLRFAGPRHRNLTGPCYFRTTYFTPLLVGPAGGRRWLTQWRAGSARRLTSSATAGAAAPGPRHRGPPGMLRKKRPPGHWLGPAGPQRRELPGALQTEWQRLGGRPAGRQRSISGAHRGRPCLTTSQGRGQQQMWAQYILHLDLSRSQREEQGGAFGLAPRRRSLEG